jgi:hypothetical protein
MSKGVQRARITSTALRQVTSAFVVGGASAVSDKCTATGGKAGAALGGRLLALCVNLPNALTTQIPKNTIPIVLGQFVTPIGFLQPGHIVPFSAVCPQFLQEAKLMTWNSITNLCELCVRAGPLKLHQCAWPASGLASRAKTQEGRARCAEVGGRASAQTDRCPPT